MPSPIGHALGAYALAQSSRTSAYNRKVLVYAMAIACLPDIDIIPGILIGPPGFNRHGVTHSFVAAILVSGGAAIHAQATRRRVRYFFLLTLAMFCSHLLLDMLRGSETAIQGLQIFWPFDLHYYNLPIHIFGHTTQSSPDNILPNAFAFWANLRMIGFEVLVLGPIAVIAHLLRVRHDRR